MAASLDQLGGRLSQRLSTEIGAVTVGVGELSASVSRIAQRVDHLEAGPALPAGATPRAPVRATLAPEPEMPRAPQAPEPAPVAAQAQPKVDESAAVMVDLDAEETPIELLDRLAGEVEGEVAGEEPTRSTPDVNLYDPPPALPGGPAPAQRANPKTYENALDRLMPRDSHRGARDGSR
jgi:hypothetical protein